jgi:hypothetical protein
MTCVSGGVLKRHARRAEEDGTSIDNTKEMLEWALDASQQHLRQPLDTHSPPAATKSPVVLRVLHLLEQVDDLAVVTVPGSSEASSIVPFNLGRKVLFQRVSCSCPACSQSEPDPGGCANAHLTINNVKSIVKFDAVPTQSCMQIASSHVLMHQV